MIKRLVIQSLPEGTDEDEFWKYHTHVHSVDFLEAVGDLVNKYVIKRVIRVIKGKKQFFVLIETWWENEEDMSKAFKILNNTMLSNGKTVTDDFMSRVINGSTFEVEEFIGKA